ncbi:MAG: hypothetical protein J0L53_04940 [Spirochaetes bacterium]|nr:hypothetical protein [Spirochaetota bacterium]
MTAAWLKDSCFDLTFIVGIAGLAGAMAGVTVLWPLLFLPMLTVHTWLFGYEHLWATYTGLLAHPEDRRRHPWLIFLVPLLVLAALFAIGKFSGMTGLYVTYFTGQFFHTVRQSWGLAQHYRRQAGGMGWDSPRLSEITLWSVPVWGFLNRCAERPTEFLFQDFWLPPVPKLAVWIAGVASAALWSYWFYTRITAYRRSELPLGHTLYMLSHLVIYLGAYILIPELCSGWLLVNVWHNVQYIAYVWMHNRRRFQGGVDSRTRLLSWLSQRGSIRATLFFLALVILALPIYYLLPPAGEAIDALLKNTAVPAAVTVGLTLTFHHYIVDGIIWKRRHNPNMDTVFHTAEAVR